MTQHTLTIPNTVLAVGSRTFGPFAIGANSQATITLDRTIAGGLNSLDGTSTLQLTIQSSGDGGATWGDEASGTFPGGIFTKNGVQTNTAVLQVIGIPSGQNSCRVVTVVAGPSPISIAGSVVVS